MSEAERHPPEIGPEWVSRKRFDRECRARQNAETFLEERSRLLFETRLQLEQALQKERRISALQREFLKLTGTELGALSDVLDAGLNRIQKNALGSEGVWVRQRCASLRTTVTRMKVVISACQDLIELDHDGSGEPD